jgi:hypothetical protein
MNMKLYATAFAIGLFMMLGAVGGIESGTELFTGVLIAVVGGIIALWGAYNIRYGDHDDR